MRRTVFALLCLSACSKQCHHRSTTTDAAPLPSSAPKSGVDDTPVPTPSPHPTAHRLEMPDGCFDIATDFEWRMKVWCQCSDLESYRMHEWGKALSLDLNGDGKRETIRTFGEGDSSGRTTYIYLGGAACATVVPGPEEDFEVIGTRHDGWADLKVVDGASYCEGNACGCRASVTVYIHKGDGYVEDPSRKVEGKNGHCPRKGDSCSTDSECSGFESGLVCVDGECALKR